MAISPPSDLVLDVAQAADPLQYHASVQKLRQIQGTAAGGKAEAADMRFADLAMTAEASAPAPAVKGKRPADAYRKFEAFMLQTFIQNMYTTDTPSVFGKGPGGEYWKSMLAEMMAGEMAESGGIGIASMLEAHQPMQEVQAASDRQAAVNMIVHTNQLEMVRRYSGKS